VASGQPPVPSGKTPSGAFGQVKRPVDSVSKRLPPVVPPSCSRCAITILTDPGGASATFIGANNQTFTGTTPYTVLVPRGVYSWRVELQPYEAAASREPLVVGSKAADTVVVAKLTRAPPPLVALTFRTIPDGAHIQLTEAGGAKYNGVSSQTFSLPYGVYAWQVQLDGYPTDRSREPLVLGARRVDTMTVSLTADGAEGRVPLQRAIAQFAAGKCAEAIPLFESLVRPGELRGAVGLEWLGARLRLGQCYQRQRDYSKAIAVFDQVMQLGQQWTAKYYLGVAYCQAGQYKSGKQHLRELEGPFLSRVAASRKGSVVAFARYGATVCSHQEYSGSKNQDRLEDLRNSVIGGLEEFIETAETLATRRGDEELQEALVGALKDAKKRLSDLQSG
jgi:hypothetical protein